MFENIDTDLLAISGASLLFGLFSSFIKEKLMISESLVATLLGVGLGPLGLKFLDPLNLSDNGPTYQCISLIEQYSRFIICIQIMSSAMMLPRAFIKKELRSISIFVCPVTIIMWFMSSSCMFLLFGLNIRDSLLLGACITPTDPILANSILKGRFSDTYMPTNLKYLIMAESSANDGITLPLIYLPLVCSGKVFCKTLTEWIWEYLFYKTVTALIFGAFFGWSANKLLQYSQSHNMVEKCSLLVYAVTLAILISCISSLLSCNEFLAVFSAGVAFSWDGWFVQETREANIQDVLDLFLNLSFFMIFGAIMPWAQLKRIGLLKSIGCSIIVIIIRRLPVVLSLHKAIPILTKGRGTLLAGWFGPIGVGAIYYITYLMKLDTGYLDHKAYAITMIITFMSVMIYGITVPLIYLSVEMPPPNHNNALHGNIYSIYSNTEAFKSFFANDITSNI